MRQLLAISLCAIAFISAPRFANASAANITISAPTINVPFGPAGSVHQAGYFDVTIRDSVGTDTLAQFQASLMLSPDISGITITGADLGQLTNPYAATGPSFSEYAGADGIGDAAGSSPNLIDPYVFAGNSLNISGQGFPYSDTTDADFADATNTGTFTMAANTVYSLEQVYYDVPAGTPAGVYALTFDTNPVFNSISNPGGDQGADFLNLVSNIDTNSYVSPGTTIFGAIDILAIPEPSSVVLMILGAIGLLGFAARRVSMTR
ncbi:MAG TPA: PEP-CTERM sorting domain-containing protein [Pirellulales bacterium]|jgi:hypothetical protein|nr:PEP-CTERM sorting domain-containing protein [Pirellulales bacterium]